MLQNKIFKLIKKPKFKLANDLAIKLYTNKFKPIKPTAFHNEYSKLLKIMEEEMLDLKYKRKFNKSLLLKKTRGLVLAKNVGMENVKKNKHARLDIDENTNIVFDGKSYNLETN